MSSGVHAADLGLISIGCFVSRQNELACIVVRGNVLNRSRLPKGPY